ncbi:neuraminidase [Aestuariibacter sp. GS-14]|uniref:BNR repeat-containing protein n=1 Tax=Aestuariibacter sp. GS-14 TaxID=2590670 RepID=UPI00112DC511|nr:BNR repeat-containing protein [Aestuariibacter sp. GS-14]TPV52886.1 neuraminidase [Aestuariibacter sp. GS-14]
MHSGMLNQLTNSKGSGMLRAIIVLGWLLLLNGCGGGGYPLSADANSRYILIADDAFAGSSVNVLAGVKHTLFTHENYQYAAYYNAQRYMVLAKRHTNSNTWQTQVTPFTGNVDDAHNHISLAVDANDFIHIAWDHHNSTLNYARSTEPGSLVLERRPMTGGSQANADTLENSVTYPQFYALPSGELLFAYRDGGSGRGNLVLNRYSPQSQTWQRLHNAVLDGEGKRSAYWDMSVDANGALHLAWIWRETPDVASNHDLAYARSFDNGDSWQQYNGKPYALPITEQASDVVMPIPQNHKLMNPPVVMADINSRPFIASYWADSPTDIPRFQVVYPLPQPNTWQVIKAPKAAQNFELSGHGTKRPPLSRAVILPAEQGGVTSLHIIYRDDFQRGQVMGLTMRDIASSNWESHVLHPQNVGAWEPSIDPIQWIHHGRADMLLQRVVQLDGNDAQSAQVAPSHIGVLIWQASLH